MIEYTERELQKSIFIRTFNPNANMIWHRDRERRTFEWLAGTDWYLQMDNQIPSLIKSGIEYHIPIGMWHRLIPGQDQLQIKLVKHNI